MNSTNNQNIVNILAYIALGAIIFHVLFLLILNFQTSFGGPGENVIWGLLFILYMFLLPVLLIGCLVISLIGLIKTRNVMTISVFVLSILQIIVVVSVYFTKIV